MQSNIFRLTLFRSFSDAWFAQNEFLTELNSPLSAVQLSFATIFQYFSFVRFGFGNHQLTLKFPFLAFFLAFGTIHPLRTLLSVIRLFVSNIF